MPMNARTAPVAARKGRILVADDEASLRLLLTNELTRAGYAVDVVSDGEQAIHKIRDEQYSVILLDIIMPKKDGMEVLKIIRAEEIPAAVIVLTGNASMESAIECMKLGASEYIKKPYSLRELMVLIERAQERARNDNERKVLRDELRRTTMGGGSLIGKSRAMRDLKNVISRLAPTSSTVLITGDSGAGKELVARTLHDQSLVADKQFVAINCASLSETLLESELFGYEKGAFTDAKTQKRGLAESADGGTLFLDEIGEIPLRFQAKLLRFLETSEIRRVGGTRDIKLEVRILCATNRPLEKLVAEGGFRADLYYRLNVLSVVVPPLHDRTDDIPLLVENMMQRQSHGKSFDRSALDMLMRYDWPGNVRELKNVIERTCVLCQGMVVTAADLSFLRSSASSSPRPSSGGNESAEVETEEMLAGLSMEEIERRHILRVLRTVDGHKGQAASILQINPKTLYYKMKSYNIVTEYK